MGFALGALTVSTLQLTLSEETMLDWGWRIPFLIAGPLGAVAIYFRLKIEESPAFQATLDAQEEQAASAAGKAADKDAVAQGTFGIFRTYWRPIVLAMVLVAAANTVEYALTSYMPSYLTDSKGYDPVHGTLLTIPGPWRWRCASRLPAGCQTASAAARCSGWVQAQRLSWRSRHLC